MVLLLTFLVQLSIGKISLYYTTYVKHHLNHIHIFFNSQTFVSDSLGGITKTTFPSVSSPCKKEVLISVTFSFHFFRAINASIILTASLEQVGESFNLYIFLLATSRALVIILLMVLKDRTHLSDIYFCSVYGTSG